MHQRSELFASLSTEDISASLNACTLSEKDEYTDDEAYRFRECRSLIEQGKTYKQVAMHFRRQEKKTLQQDESEIAESLLDISELLALASTQCEQRITLKEAAQILDSCGLPDTEQYSSEEGDRFLEACDLIKKQNKSYEEVAAYFGVSSDLETDSNATEYLVEQVSERAVAAESNLSNLVDQVTDKRAANIPHLVNQSYLKNAVRHLAATQNQTETFFAGLEQRILERIEGKTRSRSFKALNWEQNPSLPSSVKPMSLPAESENGTNTD